MASGVRIFRAVIAIYASNFWRWSKRTAMRVPPIAAVRNKLRGSPVTPAPH